jgi:hypothetical protein
VLQWSITCVLLLLIHDLGIRRGEWSGSRPGRALPPGKGPPVPIVQETGWAPEPFCAQRLRERTSLPPPGIEPLSAVQGLKSNCPKLSVCDCNFFQSLLQVSKIKCAE